MTWSTPVPASLSSSPLWHLPLAIAVGGALGALARHYLAAGVMRAAGTSFPLGTLSVNVLGSFLLGLLVALLALQFQAGPALRGFLVAGLLGGFTTFSAFSLEAALLIERQAFTAAGLYVAASVLLSILGLFAGLAAGRGLA